MAEGLHVILVVAIGLSAILGRSRPGPMATRARWLLYVGFLCSLANRYWPSPLLVGAAMVCLLGVVYTGWLARGEGVTPQTPS